MTNPLLGATIVILSLGLAVPALWLEGAGVYVRYLWANPMVLCAGVGSWGILVYYVLRRLAVVVLLRGSGAKLRVR